MLRINPNLEENGATRHTLDFERETVKGDLLVDLFKIYGENGDAISK